MPKVRYLALEIAQERLASRLKRIMGAYRLGNVSLEEAQKEATKAFDKTFEEVLSFTDKALVTRDIGQRHAGLISQQKSALKREVKKKVADFTKVLEASKNA